jgi:hypothetical protein
MVGVEAQLLVERLGPVDVGYRDGNELDLPGHTATVRPGYDNPRPSAAGLEERTIAG